MKNILLYLLNVEALLLTGVTEAIRIMVDLFDFRRRRVQDLK